MKKALFILFLLLSSHSFAQPGGGWPISFNEDYKEVDTLRKSFLALFDQSQFYISDNERTVTAMLRDSVLPYGMISAYTISDSMARNHPALKGQWTEYIIEIRLLPRMKKSVKKWVLRFNDTIFKLMKNLPKKLGILHCDIGKDMYYGKTQEDQKKVEEYEKEKIRLFNQLYPIPLFSTQHLDVYVSDDKVFDGYSQHPEWKGYYLCPDSANALRWKIWDEIKAIQKKFEK